MNGYTTMTKQRNADLIAECKKLISELAGVHPSASKIALRMLSRAAPRYYVSFEYAMRILPEMERTGALKWKSRFIRSQWESLRNDVNRLRKRHNYSLERAVATVLAEFPAPSFFLSPATIKRIINANN